MTDSLEQVITSWKPTPVTITRRIEPAPLRALADALDTRLGAAPGDAVPTAWHWLAFTSSTPQAALGEDGHPRDGHFLPPLADRRRMMAGGLLEQEEPFTVGGVYVRTTTLADLRLREGGSGRMLFTTLRHLYATTDGRLVAQEEEHLVYRQQEPGAARGIPAPVVVETPWHSSLGADGSVEVVTDPRLLFRFSALTYNTHRIHYDAPYAREVEGYPGLVVHGPLLALTMLEIPRRAGTAVTGFRFRLTRPAFAGTPLVATQDGNALAVGCTTAEGLSATATLG